MISKLRHYSHPHPFPCYISTLSSAHKTKTLKVNGNRLMSDIGIPNPPLTLILNNLGHLTRDEQMLSRLFSFLT